MTFNKYQKEAKKTAVYPSKDNNIFYPTLGLVGESGEIANKVKKVIRDYNYQLNDKLRKDIIDELGDVLWYVAALSSELNVNMSDIAKANIKKLFDRKNRGVIKGSGDKR